MKPKKFHNFKLKGNGELEFFDDDIVVEYYFKRKEIYLKLPSTRILVGEIYESDIESGYHKELTYLDKNLDVVLSEKSVLTQAMKILSYNTDYYTQIQRQGEYL